MNQISQNGLIKYSDSAASYTFSVSDHGVKSGFMYSPCLSVYYIHILRICHVGSQCLPENYESLDTDG